MSVTPTMLAWADCASSKPFSCAGISEVGGTGSGGSLDAAQLAKQLSGSSRVPVSFIVAQERDEERVVEEGEKEEGEKEEEEKKDEGGERGGGGRGGEGREGEGGAEGGGRGVRFLMIEGKILAMI